MDSASVVVPAFEECSTVPWTLDSLALQDRSLDLEVIVVAGGEDGTLEVARAHPATDRVLEDRGDGPGAARNRGAAAASGDLLLFTDADTVVPPTWVRSHRRHYANPAVVGVGGPLRPLTAAGPPFAFGSSQAAARDDSGDGRRRVRDRDRLRTRTRTRVRDRPSGLRHRVLFRLLSDWWYRASWPLGFVQQSGNNCSVRRDAFEAIGGFDERLAYLEDTDLSLRLRERGRVVYDSDCPVWTSPRRQEREGYARLFCTYLAGYLEYALRGRVSERGYWYRHRRWR